MSMKRIFYTIVCLMFLRISLAAQTGVITTVAGGGVNDGALATEAGILGPLDVTFDRDGNMYVVEYRGSRVRKIDAATGRISTLAGTGVTRFEDGSLQAAQATIFSPHGVAVDGAGNVYFDSVYLMRVTPSGEMQRIAGRGLQLGDGVSATEAIGGALGVFVDGSDQIYASMGDRVRRVDPLTGIIYTVAGITPADLSHHSPRYIHHTNPMGLCICSKQTTTPIEKHTCRSPHHDFVLVNTAFQSRSPTGYSCNHTRCPIDLTDKLMIALSDIQITACIYKRIPRHR